MRALYNLQKPEANLKSLRGFYDQVEWYFRGLHSVCIILDKLPANVRKNFTRQHDKGEFTLDQLGNASKGEIRVMEEEQISTLPPSLPQANKQYSFKQSISMFNGETVNASIPFALCFLSSSRVSVYRNFFNRRTKKNCSTEAAMLQLFKLQASTKELRFSGSMRDLSPSASCHSI